jgi:ADP-ribosyl-[dinitrogen reductase] hydrolase
MTIGAEILNRYRGCLLGLAVGDALGTTLEFKPPGSFMPITNMIGGGPFNLKPGQWTDDTSMALCLAESLIECQGFNPKDQMERYVRWWKEGHLSSTGTCFDIGNTTRTALATFLKTGNPFSGPSDSYSAGNGSLMRLAPVPMFYANNPREAIDKFGESSKTTHGAPTAVDACRYFGALIVGALNGKDKETILADHYSPVPDYWNENPLVPEIAEIAAGSFKHKNPPEIRGSGYVVQSLEAALWAFYHSESFAEGCLMAINLGDDADTTGAIYGQIAGAYYGANAVPPSWRDKIIKCVLILEMAEKLMNCLTAERNKV